MPIDPTVWQPQVKHPHFYLDECDEFLRQILDRIIFDNQGIVIETGTKPIFTNALLIRNTEKESFWDNFIQNNTEIIVSYERDQLNIREKCDCANVVDLDYIIYVRTKIDGNNRQRLIQALDRLEWLLTKNYNQDTGVVTSIINTDLAITDPLDGRKYLTNLGCLFNRIVEGTRFETPETINEKNYYTGGFTYRARFYFSERDQWTIDTAFNEYLF